MPLTSKQIEQIESYLVGQMNSDEIMQFEKELKNNSELQKALEIERKLEQGISNSAKLDLKTKMSKIEDKLDTEAFFEKKKTIAMSQTMKYISAIAAVAVLVIAATYLFNSPGSSLTPQEIFVQYYQLDKDQMIDRAAALQTVDFATIDVGRKDSLGTAIQKIEQGAYEEARDLLNELIGRYPSDKEAFYYAGLNQLQLGNYAAAISKLQIARSAENKTVRDNAKYYFALCALMLEGGDQDNIAKREFQRIAEDDTSEYQDVAKDILAQLDS